MHVILPFHLPSAQASDLSRTSFSKVNTEPFTVYVCAARPGQASSIASL